MKDEQHIKRCKNMMIRSQGSVLIALVVAMIVIGVLGAAVVSLQGTSSIHEVRANHAERAYNLAESGFRYAHSVWQETEDEYKVEALNGTSIYVPSGGEIKFINVEHKNSTGSIIFTVNEFDDQNSVLSIENVNSTYLPEYNGIFEIEDNNCTYRYLHYDNSTDTLEKIQAVSDEEACFDSLEAGGSATSLDHLVVESRGSFPGSGDLNVNRTVTYWWPISGGASGQSIDVWEEFTDEDDIEKWVSTSGSGAMGEYDIEEEALAVTDVNSGLQETMRGFDGVNNIQNSNYEVQVKVKMENLKSYLAGITFRLQSNYINPGGNNVSYGVSFVKNESSKKSQGQGNANSNKGGGKKSNIPDELIPGYNESYVIFWKDEGNPSAEKVSLLAWSNIDDLSIVKEQGDIKEWSSLLLRIEQKKDENGNKYNQVIVMVGDHAIGSYSGNSNPLDILRKSSFRDGIDLNEDGEEELPWPVKNINGWSSQNDYFTIIEWDGVKNGASLRSKEVNETDYYIKVKTVTGELLFDPESDFEIGLHTWGSNMAGKVFFDDFSVRELAEDQFIPPIQN